MIFNSLEFALFFVGVYAAYLVLPHRGQNVLLLAASYFFYGWFDPRFLGLVVLSTATDYVAAQRVYAARRAGDRDRAWLWLLSSIGINLGILGTFKYFDFFSESFAGVARVLGFEVDALILDLILPVGISFYTFQTMGYTIEVYRRTLRPTTSWIDFSLFVAFFPQLMAGPIERASRLLPQIAEPRRVSLERLSQGSWLVFWGLFKKVMIADNLMPYTRWGYMPGASPDGFEVYLLAVASAVRIYCDFSGYSDMARGLASLLGIDLMKNFRLPFFATSVAEFWQRWHVSLTAFITSFVYLPVRSALTRRGVRRSIAIRVSAFVTFTLMGLWHGAGWGFLAWGAFWGLALALRRGHTEAMTAAVARAEPGTRLRRIAGRLIVFHLFGVSLLVIMGPSDIGLELVSTLLTEPTASARSLAHAGTLLYFCAPLLLVEGVQHHAGEEGVASRLPLELRAVGYFAMLLLLVTSGAQAGEEFVYFQF